MKIQQKQVGTVDVCAPVGALVDQDGAQFSALLMEKLAASNPRIVIDLAQVPYMDSAALESLVDAAEQLSARALRLKMVNVTPTCREILELTGQSRKFGFFEQLQDAVRSFL